MGAPPQATRTSRAVLGAASVVLAAALTSCAPDESAPATGTFGLPLGSSACEPSSPIVGQEVEGTGSNGVTAFGLVQGVDPTELTVGTPIKLVVRMTGSGALAADLVAPTGEPHSLDWGPEPHSSSNYDRPGDEWGTGFTFDAPGCWSLTLEREGGGTATFWMLAVR